MKIFIRSPLSETILGKLKNQFDVTYLPWTTNGKRFYEDELLKHLKMDNYKILITELDKVTEKVLSNYPQLKIVCDCRATPENIDVNACTRHNIPLICTPARNAIAVAEMVVTLVIMSMRNVIPSINWVKDGNWELGTTPYYTWMGNEIFGKKIGIVGLGAVGRELAKRLSAFGCQIYYYDIYNSDDNYTKLELSEIFTDCDIVSLHLPLNENTKGIIDESLLLKMKSSAILVNSSRSSIIDKKALLRMAKEKRIATIILDVLDTEPPTSDDLQIINYENVILTPHIYGATYEITDHQSEIIYSRLNSFLAGKHLDKIVYNYKGLKI